MASPPASEPYTRHVLTRMTDYFTDAGSRRLWDMGCVLAMEGLWEAGYWQAHGVLPQTACDWQRDELNALIGHDRGRGDYREVRKKLTELLKARGGRHARSQEVCAVA